MEEILYPAMEDLAVDIIIGKGPSARSFELELPKFTLVGATTRAGLLTSPLRDRFGVIESLDFYTLRELASSRHPRGPDFGMRDRPGRGHGIARC